MNLAISHSWSMSVFPGKSGSPVAISTSKQPAKTADKLRALRCMQPVMLSALGGQPPSSSHASLATEKHQVTNRPIVPRDAQGTVSGSEHHYTQGLRTESDKTAATETNRQAGMLRCARDGSSLPVHVHMGQSCCLAVVCCHCSKLCS